MTHELFTYLVTHAHSNFNYNFKEFKVNKVDIPVIGGVMWAIDKDYRRHTTNKQ